MAESRFFLTDLPLSTNNQDLREVFQEYGQVIKVELKSKENIVDSGNPKIIAFVTLQIAEDDVQYCLDGVNWRKFKGTAIKVSLARESFLERLKREREEAVLLSSGVNDTPTEYGSKLLLRHLENTRKTFSDNVDLNDEDIEPALLITKKRATSSVKNGKIVIQSYDLANVHVVEENKDQKQLNEKSSVADQKRKESINKMKNDYNLKKNTIQQALTLMDAPMLKKIKFSDEEEDNSQISVVKALKSKINLFDSDDEAETGNSCLDLKSELFGGNGEKLLQSFDSRFKIDKRFVEDDEANHKEEEQAANIDNERDWQMEILEQVGGIKLNSKNITQRLSKKNNLRYDPAKDNHAKLLRIELKSSEINLCSNKSKNNLIDKSKSESASGGSPSVVSTDAFYVVSDTLKQSLNSRGNGFSLFNLFNKSEQLQQRENQLKKLCKEKIIVNKLNKDALKPFSYDSSSDSDNDYKQRDTNNTLHRNIKILPSKYTDEKQLKAVIDTFFISKNDARLKEGGKFFKCSKNGGTTNNYDELRNRLKLLIRTKIAKSKKDLQGAKKKF